jgi:hypothetical protein
LAGILNDLYGVGHWISVIENRNQSLAFVGWECLAIEPDNLLLSGCEDPKTMSAPGLFSERC